jgi:Bacterial pre-peptidase C-terminal domain
MRSEAMVGKNNQNYQEKIKFILACWMSSSLLIANSGLSMAASRNFLSQNNFNSTNLNSKSFTIAKPPDERQPEAVEQGIEKIPASETPIQREPRQPIESPLPPTVSPEPTKTQSAPTPQPNVTPTPTQSAPTPQRRQSTPVQRRTPQPQPNETPIQSAPTPQRRQSTPVQRRAPQPQPNETPIQSAPTPQRRQPTPVQRRAPQPSVTPTQRQSIPEPTNPSSTTQPSRTIEYDQIPQPSGRTTPQRQRSQQRKIGEPVLKSNNYRKINFVDVEIGVLAKGDFQSRGRYFHFYQFEGTENQLVEIRLTGSIDRRRSNNLSLDPVMMLLDSNNQVILTRGSNETTSGKVKSAFTFVRLPATGRYTIAVTSRNPRDSGRYSLALRNDRASYALDTSGVLTAQTPLRKNGSPYNVSKFQGKRDQLVSIRVDSVFEDFSPYIVLLNSRGEVVARDNDKDGRYSALIDRVRLPQDDTYYVVVISAISRENGTYRLTIF